MRLAIVGSLSLDENRACRVTRRRLGGVVTYAGLTARRLGLEVTVVTSLGAADEARLEPLRREGVEVRARLGAASTRFVNVEEGGRRAQRLLSVADPIEAVDLRGIAADLVLLGALHADDIAPDALEAARLPGARIAADLQGWVRTVAGVEVRPGAAPLLGRVLEIARVLKADPDELEVVTDALGGSEEELVERFALEALVITEGARGGRIRGPGGACARYPATGVARVVDTTGAGDVFLAAWLAARFDRGLSAGQAARFAAALAARQVEGAWLEEERLALPPPA